MKEVWLPGGAGSAARPLTGEEYRTLQERLAACWQAPAHSRNGASPVVEIQVFFDRIGFPTGSQILNSDLMALDPLFRDIALSARQAIVDCGRLPLPLEKYEAWRETIFSFDPSDGPHRLDPRTPGSLETAANSMTFGEIDSIRSQFTSCWNLPVGAPNAEELVVEVRVLLAPDGQVQRVELLDPERAKFDRFHRSAAEAAKKAVMRCSPLTGLPPSKYEEWKEMVLQFNPRALLEQ